MPVLIDDKACYPASEVRGARLAGQPKIVAFISICDGLGMTAILSNVAAAISALDKQVTLVDVALEEVNDIKLLREMGDADYLLVDLPFKPTPFASSILSNCDLVIVASSCKLDEIYETMNIVKVLLYLGIATERIAAILVDPEGILPSPSLLDIKPYLESSLGIEMAGVVSFDASEYEVSYLDNQSIVHYKPDSQLSRDIRQLASFIQS